MTESIRRELLKRLDHFVLTPKVILDLGGKANGLERDLHRKFPRARLVSTGGPAVQQPSSWWQSFFGRLFHPSARIEYLEAGVARLPLKDRSVNLIVAHDWSPGIEWLDAALSEIYRVLMPGGLFLCTTPSAMSLPGHADIHDLGSALMRAGFMEPVLDIDRVAGTSAEVIHVAAFAGTTRFDTVGNKTNEGEAVLPFPKVSKR